MKIADILNPSSNGTVLAAPNMLSPPLSPKMDEDKLLHQGKPRSRFSELEDAIICDGVAKGLTWGQISSQLPHRKRATCFNRYRTLQGIRKSRKRVSVDNSASATTGGKAALHHLHYSHAQNQAPHHPHHAHHHQHHAHHHHPYKYLPPSPHSPSSMSPSSSTSTWTPTTPPSEMFLSSYPLYASPQQSSHQQPTVSTQDPFFRRLSAPVTKDVHRLPPIYQHRHNSYFH